MPLHYYIHDQAPLLQQAQSDQTYHAIAGAGANLGRALEKLGEEHKRTNQQAKAVESFFGAMSEEERADIGLPADMTSFKNLSARDKIATGHGIFQKQAFAQVGAAIRDTNQRIKSREAEQVNVGREPKFLSALARYRQPTMTPPPDGEEGPANRRPGMDTMSAAGRAAEETGYQLPPSALSKLLDEDMGGASGPLSFDEDPVSGARFARQKNTVLPSGVNPARIPSVTVEDPNTGELVNLPINPRTGNAMLRPKTPPNPPKISEAFFKTLGDLAPGLDDPKYAPRVRSGIKAIIDAARIGKQIDDEQRDEFYSTYGIGAKSAAKPSANYDAELKQAEAALKAGRDRKKVEALFKERTGKPLP